MGEDITQRWRNGARRHAGAARATCSQHEVLICDAQNRARHDLEQFVRNAFARNHGAQVQSFMPTLLALRAQRGRICSVAGFRRATEEPLFLERYLEQPIELALGAALGKEVSRSQIVEVGNLAGSNCRAAWRLMRELPQHLLALGQRWVVFTATSAIRQVLSRYDAPLIELAVARADRVADTQDDWGRYYQSDPRVMAGFLPHGPCLVRRAQCK